MTGLLKHVSGGKFVFFRPMSFGEMIDGIFRSLRRTFWPLWWFLFIVHVPIEFFFLLFERIGNESRFEWILSLVYFVIYMLFLIPLFQNVSTHVVMKQIKEEEEKLTLRFLFSIAFNQYGKLFLVNTLMFLMLIVLVVLILLPIGLPFLLFSSETELTSRLAVVFVAAALCGMIPGSYLGIRLSLTLPVITEEGLSVKKALVRSWILTKDSYFRITGKWLLLFALQLPILFLGAYLADVFQHAEFLLNILLLLIDPIFMVLPHVLLSLIYVNQRAKKEGYDLELLLEERGGNPFS